MSLWKTVHYKRKWQTKPFEYVLKWIQAWVIRPQYQCPASNKCPLQIKIGAPLYANNTNYYCIPLLLETLTSPNLTEYRRSVWGGGGGGVYMSLVWISIQWNPGLWPPQEYSHLIITATYFGPTSKNDHTFSCKETLVNTVTLLLPPNFFCPLMTTLTGFHCTVVLQFVE